MMLIPTPDVDKGLDDLLVLSLPYILYCDNNHRNELIDHVIGAIQAHTEANKFGFRRKELVIRDYINEIDLSENQILDIRRLQSFLVSNSETIKDLLRRVTLLENSKKESKRGKQKNSKEILSQEILSQEILSQEIPSPKIPSNANISSNSFDLSHNIKSEYGKLVYECLLRSEIPLSLIELVNQTEIPITKIKRLVHNLNRIKHCEISSMSGSEYKRKYGKKLVGGYVAYYIERE